MKKEITINGKSMAKRSTRQTGSATNVRRPACPIFLTDSANLRMNSSEPIKEAPMSRKAHGAATM